MTDKGHEFRWLTQVDDTGGAQEIIELEVGGGTFQIGECVDFEGSRNWTVIDSDHPYYRIETELANGHKWSIWVHEGVLNIPRFVSRRLQDR